MPRIVDDPADPEREAAYRLGYSHGVAAAIAGLVGKLSDEEHQKIKQWVADELTLWSWPENTTMTIPPDFPKLDEKT